MADTEVNDAQTSAPELSLDDRMARYFETQSSPSPEPQDEPLAPEVEAQDADPDEEVSPEDIPADDEQPEPQTSDEVELTWNGETVKVGKDEVKDLAQLGYHLKQARETVAHELQAAQTSARQIQTAVKEISETAPQLQAIESQMQALVLMANSKGLNPQAILDVSRVDPARAQEMNAEFNVMANQYGALTQQRDAQARAVAEKREQLSREMKQSEVALLMKINPNLKDPVQRKRSQELLGEQIANWRPESVELGTNNAEILDLLIDGAKYRNLQATKRQKLATATAAPPVVKPGTSNSTGRERVDREQRMRGKLKKSGSVDDFASLLVSKGFK